MRRQYVYLGAVLFILSFSVGIGARLLLAQDMTRPEPNEGSIDGSLWYDPGWSAFADQVSASEAANRLPFDIPAVDYVPGNANLSEIYVSRVSVPREKRLLGMLFSNGLEIVVEQNRDNVSAKWGSILSESGSPFKEVQVNGAKALAAEPGDEPLSGGRSWHRTGSVMWQINRLVITVYGDFSVEELLQVAESLRISQ